MTTGNIRPENMERITTAKAAQAFIEEQVKEITKANEKSNAHPHFFIKMAKYIQNNNDNDNFIHEQFKNRKK